MIQFYEDRPCDPFEAFIYFETVFRSQFLTGALSNDNMGNYVMRLLIAKRELELSILPEWEFQGYQNEDFEEAILLRFHRPFDETIFFRFEGDVLAILPKAL